MQLDSGSTSAYRKQGLNLLHIRTDLFLSFPTRLRSNLPTHLGSNTSCSKQRNQHIPKMSYQQMMNQKFPAKLSIRDDVNSDRPEFALARRSQVAEEWHNDPSVKSQVQVFVDAKRRQHVNTPPSASNSVYRPLTPSTEIRVFELLSAAYDEPIRGNLHYVVVDFSVDHEGRPTDFAVSVSEGAMVFYTALSYVVSLLQSANTPFGTC